MNEIKQEIEFSVLGFSVRFKPDEETVGDNKISAVEIVEHVHSEARRIREKSPALNEGQVAILLALQFASEKLTMSRDYKRNVEQLQSSARDALSLIDEVCPSTTR